MDASPSVHLLSPVTVEHSPSPILHYETLSQPFPQSEYKPRLNFSPYLNVVITIDHCSIVSVKKNGPISSTRDPEIERFLRVLQQNGRGSKWKGKVAVRILRKRISLRHLETTLICIFNFELEVAVCEHSEDKAKTRDDGTCRLDIVAILS